MDLRLPPGAVTFRAGMALAALLGLTLLGGVSRGGDEEPLAALGIAVTRGAAPGYVPDRACGTCHARIYSAYQEVGMARSFFRPRIDLSIEDFSAAPFYHAASGQYLQIVRRGDRLVFRRWQLDGQGQPARVFEVAVDWALGSGHHARTYLYRTPDGALFQLPLAWYSQEGRWGMAPGFDRPDHDGVLRRVRRECLFCHNAYPDAPAGSDAAEAPHTFPAELPEGTGCQRCHGPGAEHLRRALGGVEVRERIREAIVNPARLPAARRDDVCNQCHLLPAVALPGVRRLGRGDFSFRPGDALPDYQVHVDVGEPAPAADRFEIDHQSYRLRQSLCFRASAGRLSCLTCHDPHRRVPEPEQAAHFRAACQTCHAVNACKRSRPEPAAPDRSDCVSCHMPKRRPRDVVHVVMTDHFIGRRPGGPGLLAPRVESEPVLTDVRVLEPERLNGSRSDDRSNDLADLYRTLPVVRTGASPAAVDHLEKLVARLGDPDGSLRLELAAGELRLRRYAAAERPLQEVLARDPANTRALEWLGLTREGLGRLPEAEDLLRRALARPDAERPEIATRLAGLLIRQNRSQEAVALLTAALAGRSNLVAAWIALGQAQTALGHRADAAASFRRALEIDPIQAVPASAPFGSPP